MANVLAGAGFDVEHLTGLFKYCGEPVPRRPKGPAYCDQQPVLPTGSLPKRLRYIRDK